MLTEVPGVFDHLETVHMERCLWKWTEVLAACSLFQKAPLLSVLEIFVSLHSHCIILSLLIYYSRNCISSWMQMQHIHLFLVVFMIYQLLQNCTELSMP